MKSFLPEFIAAICGVILSFGIRLWGKSVREKAAARQTAAGGTPPVAARADRRLDIIATSVGIIAIAVACSTATPKGWEVAFLFGFLWPVILHIVLRYPDPPARRTPSELRRRTDGGSAPGGAAG